MGKFNTYNIVKRSRLDICIDYLDYLISKNIIKAEDRQIYLTERSSDIEGLLLEKCYETESYRGVPISTPNAFWHFCTFIIKEDVATKRLVWNNFILDMFVAIEKNKDVCLMASRGMGKSFFNYGLYPAFKMFLYPYTRFLIVSNIPQQCVTNMRVLKTIIDGNEMLLMKKEITKGKDLKWTEREVEYNRGYVLTLSAGTSPKGQHVHYCVCDDILTDTSVYSDDEIETYVLGQLYPCVQRMKGRLIVTGTPLHQKDIYHFLMNEKDNFGGKLITDGRISARGFYCETFPIITDEETKDIYLKGVFSWEQLEAVRKTQGELKFQREYLLNCTDESVAIFSEHLVNSCVDPEYEYWYSIPDKTPNCVYVTGVDVATSGAASADYSVFLTFQIKETDKGQKKILRNIIHEKGMQISGEVDRETGELLSLGQVENIQDVSRRFNNSFVVVEKNNVGVALIQELEKRNVNVTSVTMDKPKKDNIIRYLVSEMQNKNIVIPGKGEVPEIRRLIKELTNFGVRRSKQGKERMEALAGHDDLVMAMAIANDASRNLSGLPYAVCQD